MNERTYFCIDMKSFFASVECAERNLDPMTTHLVVADETRGKGALCLAVSPSLKAIGVKNRCRLFEIPDSINYIIAKPRMRKYIEYSADIYEIYLDYFSPDDIHVYSIDESFIDATAYMNTYSMSSRELAKHLLSEISTKKNIPATAGIGTNLFLCKVALDITAKKTIDRIGYLDETLFKQTLWEHKPITDFWQIARGTAKRLASKHLYTMHDIALADEKMLYKMFGINAELIIDHANGKESCTLPDIKAYKRKNTSVSSSQILFEDYPYDKAELVMKEMTLNGCQELLKRKSVTSRVGIFVGYSDDTPPTGGMVKMTENTSSFTIISKYVEKLFQNTTWKNIPVRRLGIDFGCVLPEKFESYDLLTDESKLQREKQTENTVLNIKEKFGKNALIRGMDLADGATAIKRNKLIGGHNGE